MFTQFDFRGGLNLFDEDISLAENEYATAFNIRNRTTALAPIKLPLEDTSAPAGKKQGVFAFDQYMLLFCAGRAYYKNVITDSNWTQIESLALSPIVDFIYVCVVPASTLNYSRKLENAEQISGTSTSPGVAVENLRIDGTLAGLVVQDGLNQPWLIKSDATAVVLQTYNQWTLATRQYVPIMKQMCFINGILFGIAPDGVTILRSVSGRPLDFVVNVKVNGDKGGDAYTTSYRAGYDTVNCISPLSSGELLVATDKTCYVIEFNYDSRIFGEPTFLNRKPFSAGVVNQFSFIDLRNDYCFVDFDGIRSFNAVAQNNNEGRNSIFSARIFNALSSKQTVTAAVVFNDYSFFAVDTIYGNAMAVFDNIRQQWVCFDDYDMDEQFKMFAVANKATTPYLFAITENKLYKLFAGTEYATATVKIKALISGEPKAQLKLNNVYAVFSDGSQSGTATITEFSNGQQNKSVTEALVAKPVQQLTFGYSALGSRCFKSQLQVSWNNGAKLSMVAAEGAGIMSKASVQQITKQFNENT
jgi:hypothetical protein